MYVKSKILKDEKIDNTMKKFGAAKEYYQAFVVDEWGETKFALFTERELAAAIKRGGKNPEDQGVSDVNKSWWEFLFFWR